MTRSIIDIIGRQEAMNLIGDSLMQCSKDNRLLDLPEPVVINHKVYKRYNDGSFEPFKEEIRNRQTLQG